jgi:hypothetical protein
MRINGRKDQSIGDNKERRPSEQMRSTVGYIKEFENRLSMMSRHSNTKSAIKRDHFIRPLSLLNGASHMEPIINSGVSTPFSGFI